MFKIKYYYGLLFDLASDKSNTSVVSPPMLYAVIIGVQRSKYVVYNHRPLWRRQIAGGGTACFRSANFLFRRMLNTPCSTFVPVVQYIHPSMFISQKRQIRHMISNSCPVPFLLSLRHFHPSSNYQRFIATLHYMCIVDLPMKIVRGYVCVINVLYSSGLSGCLCDITSKPKGAQT